MVTFLTVMFVILSLILGIFIYIQQGRGGGIGAIGGGSQSIFGGSGGQEFFEKATWMMGALFILGALMLSILKTQYSDSKIAGYQAKSQTETPVNENKTSEK